MNLELMKLSSLIQFVCDQRKAKNWDLYTAGKQEWFSRQSRMNSLVQENALKVIQHYLDLNNLTSF